MKLVDVEMKEVLLTIIYFVFSFVLLILLVCLGWFLVWKLFLSRFAFVRELLMSNNGNTEESRSKIRVRKVRME